MEIHERYSPAKTVLVDHMCEICGVGRMVATGVMFTSQPPLIEHKCDLCSAVQSYRKNYPHFSFVAEGNITKEMH